jgi:uncharacterized protein with PIN domain
VDVKVIDACAMIAYLQDENGADVVEGVLADPRNTCMAHVVNIGELYTHYMKNFTQADADEAIRLMIDEAGVSPRDDTEEAFWVSVARLRGQITSTVRNPTTGGCHSIPLADCFGIALARKEGGTVVTCDSEFIHVRDRGICAVQFFRPPGSPAH